MVELMDKLLLREGPLTLAGKLKIPSMCASASIIYTHDIDHILYILRRIHIGILYLSHSKAKARHTLK